MPVTEWWPSFVSNEMHTQLSAQEYALQNKLNNGGIFNFWFPSLVMNRGCNLSQSASTEQTTQADIYVSRDKMWNVSCTAYTHTFNRLCDTGSVKKFKKFATWAAQTKARPRVRDPLKPRQSKSASSSALVAAIQSRVRGFCIDSIAC